MADILTYVLHYEGEFNKNSLGAVSEGTARAQEIGGECHALVLGGADEGAAVLGVAARRRRHRKSLLHSHALAQRAKALERRQRVLHRVGGKESRGLHLAAEPAQRLLVEERSQAAREAFIGHEPHGIRADIHRSQWRATIEASGGGFKRRVIHLLKSAKQKGPVLLTPVPREGVIAAPHPSATSRVRKDSDWS